MRFSIFLLMSCVRARKRVLRVRACHCWKIVSILRLSCEGCERRLSIVKKASREGLDGGSGTEDEARDGP